MSQWENLRAKDAARPTGRLGLLPLVCLIYLVVSGGPYGMEDAVGIAGPHLTLLLCLLVPLTLSLPTALMAAELTALMPLEGGFYFWVKEALGPFAGFCEAYMTTLYTVVDTAIYPVMFATYLAALLPLAAGAQLMLAVALVWLGGGLNLMGVRPVGRSSMALALGVIAPFVALVLIGIPRLIHFQLPPQILNRGNLPAVLSGGLTVVIWNFAGWENLSVIAGEIERPRQNYVRAVMLALPTVVLGYILPLAVCLSGAPNTAHWQTGTFALAARRLGGALFGDTIAIGGVISSFAVFTAAMLWVSRMPFVLADEGYLPPRLGQIWHGREVPARSILWCCAAFSLLVPLGFLTLVVLDVFFYMAALLLEMFALIRLRLLYPQRAGLFVIGGGNMALYAVVAAPAVTWLATFGLAASRNASDLLLAMVLLAGSWPCYTILRRSYGGPAASAAMSAISSGRSS